MNALKASETKKTVILSFFEGEGRRGCLVQKMISGVYCKTF